MKKMFLLLTILVLFFSFSATCWAVDFDLTLFGAGGVEKKDLVLKLSMLNLCTSRGYCEIGGYGYEATREQDIINFKGEGVNIGEYYYIWLDGEGRTTSGNTLSDTYITMYKLQIKIYLPSIATSDMNVYYSTSQNLNGSPARNYFGHLAVILNP